jgi:hypothetical protein
MGALKPEPLKTVCAFVLLGLLSGFVNVLLGFIHVFFLFITAGLLLGLGLGGAYYVSRKQNWLPAPASGLRYGLCGLLFGVGYPVAICFGAALALVCEGVAMVILPAHTWEAMRNQEPLPMMFFMMVWGSILGAFIVASGLMIITDSFDKGIFFGLSVAGLFAVIVTFAAFVPIYFRRDAFFMQYREMLFFGVLIPTGDTLFSALFALGLLRAADPALQGRAVAAPR